MRSVDGDVAYTIVTAVTSGDADLQRRSTPADVAVTNTDNDAAGITVTPTTGLTTTEAGGTATFTVVLTTQPTADVTIALSSSDTDGGHGRPASLTFTAANWNVAQTVTVTGVDDAGGRRRRRLHDRDGGDQRRYRPNYSGVNAADVAVTNTDNDTAGITVTPTRA